MGAPLGIGRERSSFNKPSEFAAALRAAMSAARDIEILFALWEQNVETVRAINRSLGQHHLEKTGLAPQLVAHLKQCAVALAKSTDSNQTISDPKHFYSAAVTRHGSKNRQERTDNWPTETNSLQRAFALRRQPALRDLRTTPSHAHHVRYAQPRGLGLKVSDEFTVPLCATHHHNLHDTTQERANGGRSER